MKKLMVFIICIIPLSIFAFAITPEYDAGYIDGRADGYNEFYEEGYKDGYENGCDDGYFDGYDAAKEEFSDSEYDNGYYDGYEAATKDSEEEVEKAKRYSFALMICIVIAFIIVLIKIS